MVHKHTYINIVVKHKRSETPGHTSVVFARPQGFNYESGDWIDIQFDNPTLNGGKTYSLSSSPTEPDLMITFKDGISEIKQALAQLQSGNKVHIIQYGNDYKFTLKPNRSSTLVAGGVGIAPFRSMIKEMVDMQYKDEVDLIYLNKIDDFIFKAELDAWQAQLPNLHISYIVTSELKKKDRTKALLGAINTFNQSFYIAGPESMVETTEHLLINSGVDISDIKIDSFGGY